MTHKGNWYCEKCNSIESPIFCDIYLCYFCPKCDLWLETSSLNKRPARPSMRSFGTCETCKNEIEYSSNYDCYFCAKCDSWKEKNCQDKNCLFCSGRPEKPSQYQKKVLLKVTTTKGLPVNYDESVFQYEDWRS